MTVCFPVYDFANPSFIIGMLISVIVLGALLLWLPFKKIASKRKFFFIIPFLVLLFGALSFNITLFVVHNSCDDIGKPVLVYDYDRDIVSKADAEATLK